MKDMFIKRNGKIIKLTKNEIDEAYNLKLELVKNEDEKYYRDKLKEFISNEFSKKFTKYLTNEHEQYFEQLVECCYYNQDSIDNIGIGFIYDLEKDCRKKLMDLYVEMENKLSIENFINDLVDNFENFNCSDLQGVVQARCMRTNEDENIILNEIYKKINKNI